MAINVYHGSGSGGGTQPSYEAKDLVALERKVGQLTTLVVDGLSDASKIKAEVAESKQTAKEIREQLEAVKSTEFKAVEVIGVFSSIIALLLVFVQTAIQAKTMVSAYLILITSTASLILFSALIHNFFNTEKKPWHYWTFFILCPFLGIIVLGIVTFAFLDENETIPNNCSGNLTIQEKQFLERCALKVRQVDIAK